MVYKCLFCDKYTCKYPCECQQPKEIIEIHTSSKPPILEFDNSASTDGRERTFKNLLFKIYYRKD